MQDAIKITGEFHLKVFENGNLINEFTDKNLVVKGGKDVIAAMLVNGTPSFLIDKISYGSNSTAPANSDVAPLTNNFDKLLDSSSVLSSVCTFNFSLLTSENNGATIEEFGLLLNGGVLFARKTGLTINKNNTISIAGTWTVTIS